MCFSRTITNFRCERQYCSNLFKLERLCRKDHNALKSCIAFWQDFSMWFLNKSFLSKVAPRYTTSFEMLILFLSKWTCRVGVLFGYLLKEKNIACVLLLLFFIFHFLKYVLQDVRPSSIFFTRVEVRCVYLNGWFEIEYNIGDKI